MHLHATLSTKQTNIVQKKTLLNSCDYCLPQILWLLKCKI